MLAPSFFAQISPYFRFSMPFIETKAPWCGFVDIRFGYPVFFVRGLACGGLGFRVCGILHNPR